MLLAFRGLQPCFAFMPATSACYICSSCEQQQVFGYELYAVAWLYSPHSPPPPPTPPAFPPQPESPVPLLPPPLPPLPPTHPLNAVKLEVVLKRNIAQFEPDRYAERLASYLGIQPTHIDVEAPHANDVRVIATVMGLRDTQARIAILDGDNDFASLVLGLPVWDVEFATIAAPIMPPQPARPPPPRMPPSRFPAPAGPPPTLPPDMTSCDISLCDVEPSRCSSRLDTSQSAGLSVVVMLPVAIILLAPIVPVCFPDTATDRNNRGQASPFADEVSCLKYLWRHCSPHATCTSSGLISVVIVMLFAVLVTFFALLNEEHPCATGLGKCGTISCISGNVYIQGYVFMFTCLTLTSTLLIREIAAKVPSDRRVVKATLMLGSISITLTGVFPTVETADASSEELFLSFARNLHTVGIALGCVIMLATPLWCRCSVIFRPGEKLQRSDYVRLIYAAITLAYMIMFAIADATRAPNVRADFCDRITVDGDSGACEAWPEVEALKCDFLLNHTVLRPTYKCGFTDGALAVEERVVMPHKDSGYCKRVSCPLWEYAWSTACEFGVLLLCLCYFISFGLADASTPTYITNPAAAGACVSHDEVCRLVDEAVERHCAKNEVRRLVDKDPALKVVSSSTRGHSMRKRGLVRPLDERPHQHAIPHSPAEPHTDLQGDDAVHATGTHPSDLKKSRGVAPDRLPREPSVVIAVWSDQVKPPQILRLTIYVLVSIQMVCGSVPSIVCVHRAVVAQGNRTEDIFLDDEAEFVYLDTIAYAMEIARAVIILLFCYVKTQRRSELPCEDAHSRNCKERVKKWLYLLHEHQFVAEVLFTGVVLGWGRHFVHSTINKDPSGTVLLRFIFQLIDYLLVVGLVLSMNNGIWQTCDQRFEGVIKMAAKWEGFGSLWWLLVNLVSSPPGHGPAGLFWSCRHVTCVCACMCDRCMTPSFATTTAMGTALLPCRQSLATLHFVIVYVSSVCTSTWIQLKSSEDFCRERSC